ncbi:7TM-DISM domain-containing protein [Spirosoma sp. SC4-14]|uniref:sensor histidine kinase n=1 Tax=Spirosoma sp. SC4-14 TaxID=3128900 RepID=UPI0030D5FDB9
MSVYDLDTSRFQLSRTEQPNFATDGLVHWLTFSCQNVDTQSRQLTVEVDIVYADEMSFYVLKNGKIIQQIEHYSWQTPLWSREVPSRYFAFPLELKPGESVRAYIRAQEKNGTLITPISVWDRTAFDIRATKETTAFLVSATILIFVGLVGLLVFIFLRNTLWLFYAIHAIGTAMYDLTAEGFLAHYAPAPFNALKSYAIGVSLSWLANLLFTKQYIYKPIKRLPNWLLRTHYSLVALLAIWLFLLIVNPFTNAMAEISLFINGLIPVFVFLSLLISKQRGSKEAALYLVAIVPLLFIVFIRVLASSNLITAQNWHYYFRYYAPLFEIIVLGIGTIRQAINERETILLQLNIIQQEVIITQDTERQRIAADLHDDLGGVIATINHQLELSLQSNSVNELHQTIQGIRKITAKASDKIRSIAHNLMPPDFERQGLVGSVQQLMNSLNDARFRFSTFGAPKRLAPEIELNAYRIVSELVHNAQKHAQAQQVQVQLLFHTDNLTLMVEDDGIGNQSAKNNTQQTGIGLKNISSRVNYLNARWQTDTSEQGTTTLVEIPYEFVSGKNPDRR